VQQPVAASRTDPGAGEADRRQFSVAIEMLLRGVELAEPDEHFDGVHPWISGG
jgi:hypothetical protein